MQLTLLGAQYLSTIQLATQAGLQIGSDAIVRLSVGATRGVKLNPTYFIPEESAWLHFCSARWRVLKMLEQRSTRPISESSELDLNFSLPEFTRPLFIAGHFRVKVNKSRITIKEVRYLRAVIIPEQAEREVSWGWAGGDNYSAGVAGFRDFDDWMRRDGMELAVN